jgi:hypothetical protein
MGSGKESMDVASQYSTGDGDPEIASTTTTIPGSTLGDLRSQSSFARYDQEDRNRRSKFVLVASLWIISLALTSWLTTVMRPPSPVYSYETGFDTDLGQK